jgi:hypothetical protein
MTTPELLAALAAAADVMRRSDPAWCLCMGVDATTDVEWDDALARVEDAIEAAKEAA